MFDPNTAVFDREFVPRTSSFVAWVGYDRQQRILAVDLDRGDTYYYADVPADVFFTAQANDIAREGSVGKWWNQMVKPNYRAPE